MNKYGLVGRRLRELNNKIRATTATKKLIEEDEETLLPNRTLRTKGYLRD